VTVNGKAYGVKLTKNSAKVNGSDYPLNVAFGIDESAIEATKDAAGSAPAAASGAAAPSHEAVSVNAPMPGLILRIDVKEGQQVKKNQVLLIMEAMKMENEIYAPCDGVVTKIAVSQGQQMQSDDELLVIS
ncbi:MAG: biotin/lipoyl-containing protein, partial [Sphaerochaetaceae bacterium]